MNNKHILIVDDHQIVLEGIASLLGKHNTSSKIALARTGADALLQASNHVIDVAVIDYALPDMDGLTLIERLRDMTPTIRIVVFTEHDELWVVKSIAKAMPDAVVMKSEDIRELVIAVESVAIGLHYHSKRYNGIVSEKQKGITPRETEILQSVALGQSSRDIACQLNVSENTVEYHRKKLMHRLGACNNAHLVSIAIANGLIRPANA